MAPASASVLFHPKPKVKKEPAGTPPPPQKPRPGPNPRPKTEADDAKPPSALPYTEFKLVSIEPNAWQYDIMKFDARRPVDVLAWQQPVRLNRKELRRDTDTDAAAAAVAPMLGLDGKPVIGADGRIVMVDAEGRPIQPGAAGAAGSSGAGSRAKDDKGRKKKFQKKTKQVFLVPDEVRKLRREERYPWVFEDAAQKEFWVGMLEGPNKKDTHALFMPLEDNTFKFIPAHRWYKFQKKPSHIIPTLEEAEKLMAQMQKNKDPERWLLHKRNGQAPSAATSAIFKAGAEGRTVAGGSSLVHTSGQSLGPGGRRLKTVDSGMRGLFEEDDEEGVDVKRKREKEYGGEGDLDEVEFEEDFADDEEKMEPEGAEDEEAKEMEERLKREYKTANKTREGYIDEDESEEDAENLTGAGKAMKKLVRTHDKNGAYDSDEDKNPYASSAEEEEEEEEQPTPAPAPAPEAPTQPQQQDSPPSRGTSQTPPVRPPQKPARAQPSSATTSRANSPTPGLGGHSVVAKRATSPKAPKSKSAAGGSRASSPLAHGSHSRAGSPPAARPATGAGVGQAASASPSSASSPSAPAAPSQAQAPAKRKADAPAAGGGQPPKAKKRKGPRVGAQAPPSALRDEMLVEWLKNTPDATTRDCIHYFQPCLTDEGIKARFTEMVKRVAFVKGGTMVLRSTYRDDSAGSAAASPVAA